MSAVVTSILQDFLAWDAAAHNSPAKKALRARLVGKRVRRISRVTPDAECAVGVIVSVGRAGVRVKWAHSGSRAFAHPEDLGLI